LINRLAIIVIERKLTKIQVIDVEKLRVVQEGKAKK